MLLENCYRGLSNKHHAARACQFGCTYSPPHGNAALRHSISLVVNFNAVARGLRSPRVLNLNCIETFVGQQDKEGQQDNH